MITMTMIMMTKTIVLKNDDCYNNDHVAATAAAAAYDYTRDANFNEGKVSKSTHQKLRILEAGPPDDFSLPHCGEASSLLDPAGDALCLQYERVGRISSLCRLFPFPHDVFDTVWVIDRVNHLGKASLQLQFVENPICL